MTKNSGLLGSFHVVNALRQQSQTSGAEGPIHSRDAVFCSFCRVASSPLCTLKRSLNLRGAREKERQCSHSKEVSKGLKVSSSGGLQTSLLETRLVKPRSRSIVCFAAVK